MKIHTISLSLVCLLIIGCGGGRGQEPTKKMPEPLRRDEPPHVIRGVDLIPVSSRLGAAEMCDVGLESSIRITVRNAGTVKSVPSKITLNYLTSPGAGVQEKPVSDIEPGNFEVIDAAPPSPSFDCGGGADCMVEITVDPENTSGDVQKGNNKIQCTYAIH